jgi:hypothetical protein
MLAAVVTLFVFILIGAPTTISLIGAVVDPNLARLPNVTIEVHPPSGQFITTHSAADGTRRETGDCKTLRPSRIVPLKAEAFRTKEIRLQARHSDKLTDVKLRLSGEYACLLQVRDPARKQ